MASRWRGSGIGNAHWKQTHSWVNLGLFGSPGRRTPTGERGEGEAHRYHGQHMEAVVRQQAILQSSPGLLGQECRDSSARERFIPVLQRKFCFEERAMERKREQAEDSFTFGGNYLVKLEGPSPCSKKFWVYVKESARERKGERGQDSSNRRVFSSKANSGQSISEQRGIQG